MLKLALLGPPQITRADGTPVTFRSGKELALLAYLAVEHSRPPTGATRSLLSSGPMCPQRLPGTAYVSRSPTCGRRLARPSRP